MPDHARTAEPPLPLRLMGIADDQRVAEIIDQLSASWFDHLHQVGLAIAGVELPVELRRAMANRDFWQLHFFHKPSERSAPLFAYYAIGVFRRKNVFIEVDNGEVIVVGANGSPRYEVRVVRQRPKAKVPRPGK